MLSRSNAEPRSYNRVKIPLVYILSTGRSGSTLLDVLLGAQPECWTLGEFQLLDIGAGQQMRCGCNSPLGQCSFWGPILDRIRRTIRFPIGYFRSGHHPNGKVVRWSILPSIFTGHPLPHDRHVADAYAISNFAALDEAKYAAEQHQDEVTWLIDASKDPYRLLWLQVSGYFDIRVIHLIRRPEGFVCNMMRSSENVGIGGVIKYSGRWIVDNLIAKVLIWRMFWPGAVKTVHYEALASDPESSIKDLCDWLGVPFEPERCGTTRFSVNHGVAGNRPRWDELTVTFEETWRLTMPELYQKVVSILTGPLKRLRFRETADQPGWSGTARERRRALPPWMTRRDSRS
ncbi:MAG: sulfotransferase [Geminicoccaceae bacterium]